MLTGNLSHVVNCLPQVFGLSLWDVEEHIRPAGRATVCKCLVHGLHVDRVGGFDLEGNDIDVFARNVNKRPDLDAYYVGA